MFQVRRHFELGAFSAGTFDYSKVVAVIVDNAGQLSLYPNSVKDVNEQKYGLDRTNHFELMDALGRKLNITISASNGLYQIRLPFNLPKDTYWLKIERAGKLQTVPVVKE
ncbi:T9SS type A sorting domain-containing protein [Haliscomenobacter sp.]|uniref:T9SS type A sorting domain-containing protein n=1 Tax=Haliscomenobacter sp. TaxID=2717303 RepID=UPI003BAD207E